MAKSVLFSDSETYHEQMGPIPSLRVDAWEILLQVYTTPVVTQVWIAKIFNKKCSLSPPTASVNAIIVQR